MATGPETFRRRRVAVPRLGAGGPASARRWQMDDAGFMAGLAQGRKRQRASSAFVGLLPNMGTIRRHRLRNGAERTRQ